MLIKMYSAANLLISEGQHGHLITRRYGKQYATKRVALLLGTDIRPANGISLVH
jgi:hypothetical protein